MSDASQTISMTGTLKNPRAALSTFRLDLRPLLRSACLGALARTHHDRHFSVAPLFLLFHGLVTAGLSFFSFSF
jgi:hypothetical protein